MIELKHVRKEFPDVTPLKDVNAVINDGDVIAIIGPSGTGKSTLLRALNMLDPPTSGEIIFDGECITSRDCNINNVRRKMGMVFQSFNLFGHLTVLENIIVPQTDLLGRSFSEAREKALSLLGTVGLRDKALAYPDELSGGQKQRISIARALAKQNPILVMDDSTSALDMETEHEIQDMLMTKDGVTKIIVAHRISAVRHADEIIVLDEGRVAERGTHDQLMAMKGLYYDTYLSQYEALDTVFIGDVFEEGGDR